MRTLVLGLGNELLGDDAVGLAAVRALRAEWAAAAGPAGPDGDQVEIVETALSGLALLDLFIGFDRALIIDSVCTGRRPPGTVSELAPADLDAVVAPSPHFSGLPELLALARRLEVPFPAAIRILTIETADPYTLGAGLTPAVERGLPELVARAREILRAFDAPPARAEPPEPRHA